MAHEHHGFGPAYVSPDPEYAVTPPGAAHEYTDANVWMIVKFSIWLVITAVVIHVGLGLMFWLFVEQREIVGQPQFPLATGTGVRLPAQPRLQQFPANEAADFRRQDAAAFDTYGWVDRNAGTVRLPISEAMRLAVERGLPYRANGAGQAQPADAQAAPAPTPDLIPADSSSGRTMERRRQ